MNPVDPTATRLWWGVSMFVGHPSHGFLLFIRLKRFFKRLISPTFAKSKQVLQLKMKQVILNIPENKYSFFMELVKNLDFVRISEEIKLTKKQKNFVEGTQNSLEQVKQHLKGEIKLKTADQLYDEL